LESKVRKKVIRLRYFPLAAIERAPRRFRNTRGRRRRPKGARTAAHTTNSALLTSISVGARLLLEV
jgi:hypothetical protein